MNFPRCILTPGAAVPPATCYLPHQKHLEPAPAGKLPMGDSPEKGWCISASAVTFSGCGFPQPESLCQGCSLPRCTGGPNRCDHGCIYNYTVLVLQHRREERPRTKSGDRPVLPHLLCRTGAERENRAQPGVFSPTVRLSLATSCKGQRSGKFGFRARARHARAQ